MVLVNESGAPLAFPTGVGMNRSIREAAICASGVPHGRGDEPAQQRLIEQTLLRSPRSWG